jgi:type VI protein secretion system component VasK
MYFGPIGLMGLIGLIRLKKNKIIFALTAFAATNMVLYPGWSFGHPYWIYYFVPAAAMGAGWCLSRIKNRNMMIGVLIISLIWWGRIESWKTGQIKTSLPAVTEVGNQTAANETKEEQQAKPAAIIEAKLLDILKVPQI